MVYLQIARIAGAHRICGKAHQRGHPPHLLQSTTWPGALFVKAASKRQLAAQVRSVCWSVVRVWSLSHAWCGQAGWTDVILSCMGHSLSVSTWLDRLPPYAFQVYISTVWQRHCGAAVETHAMQPAGWLA